MTNKSQSLDPVEAHLKSVHKYRFNGGSPITRAAVSGYYKVVYKDYYHPARLTYKKGPHTDHTEVQIRSIQEGGNYGPNGAPPKYSLRGTRYDKVTKKWNITDFDSNDHGEFIKKVDEYHLLRK
jgi:hypothetical protein